MNEQENLMRVLRDNEPLVTSLWCYVGIHTWEKWSDIYQPKDRLNIFIQHRICDCCGKYVTRKVKLPPELG